MAKKVNKTDLSEILGVNERTLSTWQKDGLPIDQKHGRENLYDTAKVIEWMIRRHTNRLSRSNGEILDLEAEKARLTRAQADTTELKLSQTEGQLLEAEDVQATWENNIMACRAKLLSLPSKVAPVVAHESEVSVVESNLQDAIFEALNELSQTDTAESE